MTDLAWLPEDPQWRETFRALPEDEGRWEALVALSRSRMDFVRTGQLDRRLTETRSDAAPELRIAILASATIDQLLPGLRIAGLRRGLRVSVYTPDYGQFRQAVLDPDSDFHRFAPHVVLFLLDARSQVGETLLDDDEAARSLEQRVADIVGLWQAARGGADRIILHQALLPIFELLLGNAENRLAGSPAAMVGALNRSLRTAADAHGIDMIALDDQITRHGLDAFYAPALWHRAKQEISPAASPLFGELVLRIVDARQGRAAKCLVLDLDNTLWGGVIGDHGLEGIAIGQGSADGEAFVAFQTYVKALAARGVILAICSKNDEANAREPFDKHADMVLRIADIACFVANWDDKATNLRRIAAELNIGLDALVFADDNPFERNIVRRELPMVAVPELPDDPALYARTIAGAGFFESVGVTGEDRDRGQLYRARGQARALEGQATDLAGYLASLDMKMPWGRFDAVSLKRVTQLANKTNQFNLTTRRYTETEIAAIADDPQAFGLHFRLVDRFADHGIIAVVIGRKRPDGTVVLESWLMSCRVLGREAEAATLAIVAAEARRIGGTALIGHYRPSAKNNMVRDHYARLGFTPADTDADTGAGETAWRLDLDTLPAAPTSIATEHNHG
jgi:FkbH-like protein